MKRHFTLIFVSFIFCFRLLTAQVIDIPFTGDYPDPTIVRVGNDFYMTHTSHVYYPGLLIWHSVDLKKWTPLTRALHTFLGSVWAPELVCHKGKYYIYIPTGRGHIYVITADHPKGPWTEPVELDARGIDPGHIVGKNGKRYLHISGGRMHELSDDGLSVTTAEKKVYDGWKYPADWAVECFCLESPKLIFHNNYYYMVSAQGGTSGPSTSHMAVVARSKSCEGPWENSPYNPLIHTYNPFDTWVSKGHATLFNDASGNWFIVYHACQPGKRPQGRSTLIEPVVWTDDGWPRTSYPPDTDTYRLHQNTALESDDFSAPTLKWQWFFWGVESADEYALQDKKLILHGKEGKTKALMAVASQADYEVTVKVKADAGVETGLTLFYDENQYVGIGMKDGKAYGLSRGKPAWGEVKAEGCQYLRLQVAAYTVSLSYSVDGETWLHYHAGFDASGYHTNMLGDFSSLKPAILCKGNGKITVESFTIKPL